MQPRRPGEPPRRPNQPGSIKPAKALKRPGSVPQRPGGLSPRAGVTADRVAKPSQTDSVPDSNAYQNALFDGERFFKSKDYDTAFEIYQKALTLAPPGDSRALKQLCRCYRKRARKPYKNEQFKTVVKMLEAMLALEQVEPHLTGMDYKILAEAYLELGKLKQADAAMDQALRLKPELEYEMMGLEKRLRTEILNQEMNGLH